MPKDDGSCSLGADGEEVTEANAEFIGRLAANCETPRYHCRPSVAPFFHVTKMKLDEVGTENDIKNEAQPENGSDAASSADGTGYSLMPLLFGLFVWMF